MYIQINTKLNRLYGTVWKVFFLRIKDRCYFKPENNRSTNTKDGCRGEKKESKNTFRVDFNVTFKDAKVVFGQEKGR